MSFKNNSPSFSYISWNSCYITYNGIDYIIEDGYTCQKYVYWNFNNNPYKFETTNLLQDEMITKQLIAVNDKGMATTVELDEITLTFTEKDSGTISSQITDSLIALYDKQGTNTNYEEKFMTIEKNLEGITSMVGELEATSEGLNEKISTFQQTADNISMEVSNVQKEYSRDKEFTELRDKIGEALLSFSSELGLFTSDLNDAMKDNELSNTEKTALTTEVNNLKKYKMNIDTIINEISLMISEENGNITALQEEKTVFGNAFDSLMTIYNTVITDNTFTTTEITSLTTAIGNMNTRCTTLGNVLEDSVLLPFDGKIIEEISKFSVKSNEISLGVSEIEKSVELNSEQIAELKITSEGITTSINKVETEYENINRILEDKLINISVGATNLLEKTFEDWREIIISTVGTVKATFHCSELELKVGEKIAFGVDVDASNKSLSARIDFWSDLNGTSYKSFNGNVIEKGNRGRSTVVSEIPEGYEYITLFIDSGETDTVVEFYKCAKLERGSIATDWSPSPKDTETRIDDALTSFIDDWEGQIDGVVQTYAQSEDPSRNWNPDEKTSHEGDIWYDTMDKNTYRWDGSVWIKLENNDAIMASELAQTKAQVFVSTPKPPYYKGDIWITDLEGSGVVKTCVNEKITGNFVESDWIEGLKYTDDSKVIDIENDLHNNYSTTLEMERVVTETAEGITDTISKTYYTKDETDGKVNVIEKSVSELKRTSDSLVSDISNVKNEMVNALTSGTSMQYYLSTSTSTLEGGEWLDSAPEWTDGKYMWQRIKYTYVNHEPTYGNPVCIAGARGQDGTSVKILGTYGSINELNAAHPNNNTAGDGYIIGNDLYVWTGNEFTNVGQIKGKDGESGKTSYFHVKYSDDGGKTFTENNGETVGMYMGTCVDFIEQDPTTTASYKWVLIKGEQGINGAQGVKGDAGTSIIFRGSYSSAPSNPQDGWCYYNTTEKKSFVFQDNVWYQMTIDGAKGEKGEKGDDGLSLEYKGELKNPPSSPSKNWAYKDSDNGIVYIYTGSYWEVLTYDGNDGAEGTKGDDGKSVFITYNSSTSKPSTPTGNGTTDGWHTTPTDSDIWMSQKIASSSTEGTWGAPIKIKGETGNAGQGLVSSTPQWYKSTSKINQTGGSWSDVMPSQLTGYYVWVRYKQVWTNPSATTYTEPVLEQLAENIKSVTEKQATLEQTLDGFKTTVSQTYATKDDVNNVSVNMKNYLVDTDFSKAGVADKYTGYDEAEWSAFKYTSSYGANLDSDAFIRDEYVMRLKTNIAECISANLSYVIMRNKTHVNLAKKTEYTMTAWIYKGDHAKEAFIRVYEINDDGSAGAQIAESERIVETTGGFVKVTFTFISSSTHTTHSIRYYNFVNTTDYKDGDSNIFIYHPILTLGNVEVDWSPAPEDFGNYLESNYSTTKDIESKIEQTAGSITNSISETYATKVDLKGANDKVSNLTERVTSAESKLTKYSLTTTIGDHYTTSTEVDKLVTDKKYATVSMVEQTNSSLTAKFEESGGYNLIKNSAGAGGTAGWNIGGTAGSISTTSVVNTANINRTVLRLSNTSASNSTYAYCTRFPLSAGKTYTLSFNYMVGSGSTLMEVYIRGSYTVGYGDNNQPTAYDEVVASIKDLKGGYAARSVTFTVPKSIISGYVQIRNNAALTDGATGYVYWTDMLLEEGSFVSRWSPHPDEIYSGITTIDKDGIRVSQSNYGGYTRMNAAGFYINDGTQNVLSATSSGLTVKGNITGSTISASCKINSDSIIYANGGIYTKQDIRGLGTDPVTGGLTLVTGTGNLAVRTEKNSHSVYLQPGDGEVKITKPADTDNYADLRLNRLVAQSELYSHGDVRGNKVYANGVQLTSDRNKKRDIELYQTDALNEICTTPVYTYHLDGDLDEEMKRIGLIMQEAPVDAVDIGGEGIDLYQMCTMMWKGIQQLKEENDKLKKEIEKLKENK